MRRSVFACIFLVIGLICAASSTLWAADTLFPIVMTKVVTETAYVANPLPDTGIYFCSDNATEITCPRSDDSFYGQDGQYNIPARQHNYTLNEDSNSSRGEDTVSDNVTGLMWMRGDGIDTYTWQEAETYCDGLSYADYDDWRLPTFHELAYLLDRSYSTLDMQIDPVFSGTTSIYWTGTITSASAAYAWNVSFVNGIVFYHTLSTEHRVRCVRSEQ